MKALTIIAQTYSLSQLVNFNGHWYVLRQASNMDFATTELKSYE